MLGVVIGLLLLGILLLLLEILFVPGTTIVGVGGIILLAIGIYLSYAYLGTGAGHISLASCVVVVILSLAVLLKGNTWKRMALDSSIDSRSLVNMSTQVTVGDRGVTVSRLNPMGKALFGEKMLEVTADGEFVDEAKDIEVVKVEQNKIKVKIV
jgi:membrane-bound ClpP family serine protease